MLAILSTHPIQYQVPLWKALAEEGNVPFEVWYLSDHGTRASFDRQFGRAFAWDIDTLSGYPHHFLRVNEGAAVGGFWNLRLAESLRERMRKRRVRALWVQGWQVLAYWQAVREAKAAGVPVWLRGESNDLAPPARWLKRPAKRLLLSRLFSRVDRFLYIGQANRRLYESYGVSHKRLHPAPYCVDNERFSRQADDVRPQRACIRREWGIPEDAFCVLFAGKFVEKKRPLDVVEAARVMSAHRAGRPVHLLFVGSGELGGALRQASQVVYDAEASAAGAAGADAPRASFAGFLNQTEISKAYVAADCLVLPSDYGETWGLVANEAMASGLPCVASDACGCAEDLITPVDPAFRFPLGDTKALANALVELMSRPPKPSAVRHHVAKFSLSATVETVKKLYGVRGGTDTSTRAGGGVPRG